MFSQSHEKNAEEGDLAKCITVEHSTHARVLPSYATNIDLILEAKNKDQAVFDLIRTDELPGWDLFNNIGSHKNMMK